jgi:hypothetical protein
MQLCLAPITAFEAVVVITNIGLAVHHLPECTSVVTVASMRKAAMRSYNPFGDPKTRQAVLWLEFLHHFSSIRGA